VARALSSRPRLALDANGQARIEEWLTTRAPALRAVAEPLLVRVADVTLRSRQQALEKPL
jgi:hypothetical protein